MASSPPAPSLFKAAHQLSSSSSTTESDFTRSVLSPLSSPLLWSDVSRAKLQVGGVVAATASVGFLEACLHFERKPIPLRFAVRYALSNILLSPVWTSASAELVAAASGVSTSALLTSSSSSAVSPLPQSRAKQLLMLRSVRSMRHVLGSYALAWSLYNVYCAPSTSGDGEDGDDQEAGPVFFEKVVRLAPEDSLLSRVSRNKHGEHVTTLPMLSSDGLSRKPHPSTLAIDWDAQGLLTAQQQPQVTEVGSVASSSSTRVKLVEVELQEDEWSLKNARRVIRKAHHDLPGELLQTVALLPATPSDEIPPSELQDFDVCVSPLAVTLQVLASACELQDARRVLIVCVADNESDREAGTASGPFHFSALSRGLLYQHGIQTTTLAVPAGEEALEVLRTAACGDDDGSFVIIAARKLADATALANNLIESSLVASESMIIVCEESCSPVHGAAYNLLPAILKQHFPNHSNKNNNSNNLPQVLSLADLSDDLLQSVREALRSGHSTHAIQQAIFATYGPQKTLMYRQDAFSDVSKSYI